MTFNAFTSPRFERGVGTWGGNSVFGSFTPAPVHISDTVSYIGSRSGRVTWPAPEGVDANASANFPLGDYAGVPWTAIFHVYVPAGHPDVKVGFTFIGQMQTVTAKDTWTEVRVTATARADVDDEFLSIMCAAPVEGTVAYMDAIMAVPEGNYSGPYIDGATAGAHWLGKPFLSSSTTEPIPEPALQVDIAWTGSYGESNPAWTDITDYVEAIRTQHGRPTEIGSIEAGVVTLSLDNTDGHFTAGNDQSPFYPNVRPQRQVRFRAQNPIGVWEDVAHGTVERWPTQYDGLTGNVDVTCTDTLDWLDSLTLSPAFEYELNATSPEDIWPMDQDDTEKVPSQIHPWRNVAPTKTQLWDAVDYNAGKVESGAENLIPYGAEGRTSFKLSGATRKSKNGYTGIDCGYCLRIQGPEETEWDLPTDSFTVSGYFKVDKAATPDDDLVALYIARQGAGDSVLGVHFEMLIKYMQDFDGWVFQIYQKQNPGDTTKTELANLYMPGQVGLQMTDPVFMGFSWDHVNEQFYLFLNDSYSGPHGVNYSPRYWARRVFRLHAQGYTFPHGDSGGLWDGKTQYLARWNRVLDESEVSAIYAAGQGRIGEYADERINYILDQSGWPSDKRKIGKSTTRVERAAFEEGQSALEVARKVANDSLGLLYVDGAGDVVYEPRHDRAKDYGSWVLDEDNGTAVESGLLFEQATEDIINVADVNNSFGIKARLTNEASRDEFGDRQKSVEIRVTDQDEARQHGYHYVNRYGEPHTRVTGVEVNASASADGSLWPFVTSVNLSDRISIGDLPSTAPASALDFFVEAIRHEITRDGDRLKWSTSLDVSPAPLREAWVLGDFDRSRLGSTTKLHF